MNTTTFRVGSRSYRAEVLLNTELIVVTMSVYAEGEDRSILDIEWDPKSNRQYFRPNEEGFSMMVLTRSLRIWETYREKAASMRLHLRKPKPASKALRTAREQLWEALGKGDEARCNTLSANVSRHLAKNLVPLALA